MFLVSIDAKLSCISNLGIWPFNEWFFKGNGFPEFPVSNPHNWFGWSNSWRWIHETSCKVMRLPMRCSEVLMFECWFCSSLVHYLRTSWMGTLCAQWNFRNLNVDMLYQEKKINWRHIPLDLYSDYSSITFNYGPTVNLGCPSQWVPRPNMLSARRIVDR